MGSYRQHVSFASALGVGYAWAGLILAGVHWIYGSIAALLTALGGLLPDMDSDHSVQLRGFTGLLGVVAAYVCWSDVRTSMPEVGFELRLWALILPYLLVRHAARRIIAASTVHRGIWHSFPVCLISGAIIYLVYPHEDNGVRAFMALAMMLGFLSHLLLDEVCSVDLKGRRIKKSFGTAFKFWSQSTSGTLTAYLILSLLSWLIIERWPLDQPWTSPPPPDGWPEDGLLHWLDDETRAWMINRLERWFELSPTDPSAELAPPDEGVQS